MSHGNGVSSDKVTSLVQTACDSLSDEDVVRVTRAAEEYLAALERGERPDRKEFLEDFADIAAPLSDCLDGLELMHAATAGPIAIDQTGTLDAESSGPRGQPMTLGDYRLLREVGRGGMGVVYQAEQLSLRRQVALKVLPFAAMLDQRQLTRFRNEAQAAAQLHHTHIVPVFAVGCERGVHYYAMQYIEGHTLAEVIRELQVLSGLVGAPPAGSTESLSRLTEELTAGGFVPTQPSSTATSPDVPAKRAVDGGLATITDGHSTQSSAFCRSVAKLGLQAAEALEHAHQLGVVHRDIKPSNLMLDSGGQIWITDFGLAQLAGEPAVTTTGDLLGTLQYMSPEQALAGRVPIDHRTDIYSLGRTLYELLTLKPAFSGADRQKLLLQIAVDEPRRPRRINKAIPIDLETIVLKAMARGPAGRYDTAQDMADDLRRFLEDKPIRAKPPGPWVRLRKWTRRHKALSVAVALAVLAAGVAGTTTAVRHHLRLTRLNTTAQRGLTQARLAMAQAHYADAQRELTYVKAQLAGVPALLGRYAPQVEHLLRQADLRLRLGRFEALVDEARFSAQVFIRALPPSFGGTDQQLAGHLSNAHRRCSDALAVFDVVDNDHWLADVEPLLSDPGELESLKDTVAEMLLLLAHVEFQLGEVSGGDASRTRRAIELLDRLEAFSPNIRALYEYRSTYWEALGESEAAQADAGRAVGMAATKWLDHCLLAQKLWPEWHHEEAMKELEAALALKVDSYWTWYTWALAAEWLDYPAHQVHQAMSICIGLRPQEAAAWIGRGWEGREPGDTGREVALADLAKGLTLTTDPGLRGKAYSARSVILAELGQTEAALRELEEAARLLAAVPDTWDLYLPNDDELEVDGWRLSPNRMEAALPYFSRLIELRPDRSGYLLARARWYMTLGQPELGHADVRELLEIWGRPTTFGEHMQRIKALEVAELWREVVRACLEMETAELDWNIFPYSMYPTLANAYRRLGGDYLASGQFDEDLEPYEESMRIDMKHAIARVLVAAGAVKPDPETALPLALQVVQARPDSRYYRHTLGVTYYRLGRHEEAIETLQGAIDRLRGGVAVADDLFFLAMAEWQRGNRERARLLYDQGVDWMVQNETIALFTDQYITYRYEAAQLMSIPGAPMPAEKDRLPEDRK